MGPRGPRPHECLAHDRLVTTTETAARRMRHLDGELAKIGEEWPMSETAASANTACRSKGKTPRPSSALATADLRTA